MKKRLIALLLLAALLLTGTAQAAPNRTQMAQALCGALPCYGEEWAIMALARGGAAVPAGYYAVYYASLEQKLKEGGGVLSARRYTDYSRVVVALAALGTDARNVAGYDLLAPLEDFDAVTRQGVNGAAWALLALDTRNTTSAQRQNYVNFLLDAQLPDGGWSLQPKNGADPDVTAMVLQALAKYQTQSAVRTATTKALTCLSGLQDSGGGFAAWGVRNTESCAQVILALCELGVSLQDARFVKNGKTVLDAMQTFRRSDGTYSHDGSGEDRISTEQALCALTAAAWSGSGSFFRMADAPTAALTGGKGLAGKNAAVKPAAVTKPDAAFPDVSASHANSAAILALAARGVLNGRANGQFCPDETMTRAEFAAAVVRALGMTPRADGSFDDVPASAWYAPFVGTAARFDIVNGVGDRRFDPNGTITRQEAAAMVARAAALCGVDTNASSAALARYPDRAEASGWAMDALAFCAKTGLLTGSRLEPKRAIRRGEIAQMLYGLLAASALL